MLETNKPRMRGIHLWTQRVYGGSVSKALVEHVSNPAYSERMNVTYTSLSGSLSIPARQSAYVLTLFDAQETHCLGEGLAE